VFASEHAVDFADLARRLRELEAQLRDDLRRDGVGDDAMRVQRWLDCRYRGQGYELRVPVAGDHVGPEVFDAFHDLHRQEYGRGSGSPVEIVNLRITVSGERCKLERVPARTGGTGEALLGTRSSLFRVDGELRALQTTLVDRAALAPGEDIPGPAILIQEDTTTVVPPGWRARAEEGGVLVLSAGAA
jgi:N-methylhydantoinase A/oxoprolinase/acetone carboxylase beta subunit